MTEYSSSDLLEIGRIWLERIEAAERREKDWRDQAEKAEAAFTADPEENGLRHFNIVHSNVETIVPAIYNSTPRPDIRPRHGNQDEAAKDVADIIERVILTEIDDNRLDVEIEKTAQDAFLAGRGIIRLKFDADEIEAEVAERPFVGGIEVESAEIYPPEFVEYREVEVSPARVENERVIFENVSWRDYREGPAKRWSDVPWVAYRHEVSEAERQRLENPDIASKYEQLAKDTEQDRDQTIWEVWDKESRRVFFVVQESGKVLDIIDDPLTLQGFFPQPEPVQPITPTGKRCPTCPYSIYKTLAEELDTTTRRINAIMKGLKVRGVIAGDASVMDTLAALDDNQLAPVENLENLVAAGGLDKAVMWWPVDTAINVLAQLYQQREATKQMIYEITGISDIVRGASQSQETATAQQIKTQWGSLRIKKLQRTIERTVRDVMVMVADIVSQHFSYEAVQRSSGIQITPQIAQMLQKPLDHYRIDVETDSTIRADLTKSRQEMSEFLQGTASYFQTMAPIAQQAPQAVGALAKMYAAFAQQFNLGRSAETALDEFVKMAEEAANQPPQPSPEQMKMEREAKMDKAKLALDEKRFNLDAQKAMAEHGIKVAGVELDRDKLDLEEAKAEVEAGVKLIEAEQPDRPVN